jgi:hypothetical protein
MVDEGEEINWGENTPETETEEQFSGKGRLWSTK